MKSDRSRFLLKPRYELLTLEVEGRHWFFWKKTKRIKGIRTFGAIVYFSQTLDQLIEIPEGTVSDGASVPQIFWWRYPPFGGTDDYVASAVIHDVFCVQGAAGECRIDSATAAKVFRESMAVEGVRPSVRWAMYNAVRWFGPRWKAKATAS